MRMTPASNYVSQWPCHLYTIGWLRFFYVCYWVCLGCCCCCCCCCLAHHYNGFHLRLLSGRHFDPPTPSLRIGSGRLVSGGCCSNVPHCCVVLSQFCEKKWVTPSWIQQELYRNEENFVDPILTLNDLKKGINLKQFSIIIFAMASYDVTWCCFVLLLNFRQGWHRL